MTPLLTVALTGAAALLVAPTGAWDVVPSPSPSRSSNLLRGVAAVGADTVWSVGNQRDDTTGRQRTLTQRWNGAVWQTVASPAGENEHDTLTAVSGVSPTDLWAVGFSARSAFDPDSLLDPDGARPLILRGDGLRWTPWPVTKPGGVAHLAAVDMVGSRDGWAVGSHLPEGSAVPQGLIMRWNGSVWAPAPAPDLGPVHLTGVSANHADDVWAVGYRGVPGDAAEAVALHWDGLRWGQHELPADGGVSSALFSVATVSDQEVWAVGYTWSAGKRLAFALRRIDGAWQRIPVSVIEEGTQFRGVVAVATGVWAVGYYVAEGVDNALAMTFDGTSFVKRQPPAPGTYNHGGTAVTGITATRAGELWAVGCLGPNTRVLRRAT
ncbi:hypothetical protein QLQ12_17155 [Actinoplanes sp. NEAU-A12]|uniref:Uncharacterized protein n=1 Tax=Actinoplanes sandaracinus TaxID=3045177 RepID=A0ABT6WKS3_9ACTN|nr:hypothetical protein [Actinoplanes sandaracinus]MDI6100337.1 hypothetical protein [Actinoplanes sandaracinus]